MHTEWYHYVLAVAAGFIAGGINTLAGSGSLITLPMLLFLGLPANIANGTNRIGIFTQTLISVFTFKKAGKFSLSGSQWMIIPALAGALIGAQVAVGLTEGMMKIIIGLVMLLMLYFVLSNSERWLRETSETHEGKKKIISILLYILVGFYGGFIQVGVGIFLLSTLVIYGKYSITHANAVKNLIVFCYTLPVLIIFIYHGQVNWGIGSLLAIGQGMGAWFSVRYATGFKNANVWIRRLLVIIILISVLKTFNVFHYMASFFSK